MGKKPTMANLLQDRREAISKVEAGLDTIDALAQIALAGDDDILARILSADTRQSIADWYGEKEEEIRALRLGDAILRVGEEGGSLRRVDDQVLTAMQSTEDEIIGSLRQRLELSAE